MSKKTLFKKLLKAPEIVEVPVAHDGPFAMMLERDEP
jgi:hypothetical protein